MKILKSYTHTLVAALLLTSTAFAQKSGTAASTTDAAVPSSGFQSVNSEWKPSLTNDGKDDNIRHVSVPIPWQYIRDADILWKKRVWREIDVREKPNMAFRYQGDENTGGGMFIEILIDAVKRGKIPAYGTFDDRFTSQLSKEDVLNSLVSAPDTIEVEDPTTGEVKKTIVENIFKPEDVTTYEIKEDWIFDRNQGKMVVRIVGICPLLDVYDRESGAFKSKKRLFWLYYPDIKFRELLASYEVYNPKNDVHRATWDEFFESHQFASKVIKMSNPLDKKFSEIFGDDSRSKMEALYESQRTMNEIMNTEHDMWVY